jgi:hemerythrin superfamily protein
MTTTDQTANRTDAVTLLSSDHRTVDRLFSHLETSTPGAQQRGEWIKQVIRELSVHAAIEEQILYPAIRDDVPGGDQLAEEAIDEHQQVKEMLARLEKLDADDGETDAARAGLITHVRQHVQEEERPGGLFDQLRSVVDQDRLDQMGEQLEAAKKMAPTHPHPHAPNTPPGNIVGGVGAAVVDKARDAVQRD